jgi:hypothetical protein
MTTAHAHECRACGLDFTCTSELDYTTACSTFEGLCPRCEKHEAEQAVMAGIEHRCWCEHAAHEPDLWCHNSAEGGAVSDWVGNVCRQCADGHLAEYIIWPEPLLDDREIWTVSTEVLTKVRAFLHGCEIPSRPAYEDHFYIPLTSDQRMVLKNELGI